MIKNNKKKNKKKKEKNKKKKEKNEKKKKKNEINKFLNIKIEKKKKKKIQELNTFSCVFHFMIISENSYRPVEEKLLPSTV